MNSIRIAIDGIPFTVQHREYSADELLALDDIPSQRYDIGRSNEPGTFERFATIRPQNGDRFYTARISSINA